MIKEIKNEIKHIFWIFVIIIWGLMFCDMGNRIANFNINQQIERVIKI